MRELAWVTLLGLVACSGGGKGDDGDDTDMADDTDMTGDTDMGDTDMGDPTGDAQTPPQGHDHVEAWLAAGHYLDWHCEAEPQSGRFGSPHGVARICSNDALAGAGSSPWPVGSAGVKEIYDDMDAIIGYAVYLKVNEGTEGSDWYWYERVPIPGISDERDVVADGMGDAGNARDICVGCHAAAGDGAHPGADFVYVQVTGM
ncbi:MAG TPA: hypothetical protein PKA64_13800 [Myxococcota bacterium]|nr:hypothetical protein [Myxococcota bacterium]